VQELIDLCTLAATC